MAVSDTIVLLFHRDILYRLLSGSAIQLLVMPHCIPEKLKNSWVLQVPVNGVCAQISPAGRGHAEVKVIQIEGQQYVSLRLLIKSLSSLDPKNDQNSEMSLGQQSKLHLAGVHNRHAKCKNDEWNQTENYRQQ